MADPIDVRITGRGHITKGQVTRDASARARCTLCASDVDAVAAVASIGGPEAFACAACLRARLDALSVGRYRLAESDGGGTPWGKVSG